MLAYVKETFKNSLIYGVGNISVKVVGFVLLPFLTDLTYLSLEAYGALGVFEAINQILISLLGLGLYNALFRWYYEQTEEENKATFFTAGLTVLFFSLIFTAGAWWNSDQIARWLFDGETFKLVVPLVIAATGLQTFTQLPATLMRLQDKAVSFTVTNLVRLGVMLIVTLWSLIWERDGLLAIYYGQIAGHIAYIVVVAPYVVRNMRIRFHKPVFTEMLQYGLPMMLTGLAGASLNVIDRFVINSMSGLKEVGFYSLGYKIANVVKVFIISSVSMALTPMIFRKMNDDDHQRFYVKTMTYYGFAMMVCIMGVSLFSQEVVKVFTGSSVYWTAFEIIPVLTLSLFFVALKDVAVTGLHITKRMTILGTITIISLFANLGLNILLVPFMGAMGAAAASLITKFVFFIVICYYAHKAYPINYEWNKLVLMLIVGSTLIYAGMLSSTYGILVRLPVKVAVVLLFPIILYPFGFYEPIEKKRIKAIWQRWKSPGKWPEQIKQLFKETSQQ